MRLRWNMNSPFDWTRRNGLRRTGGDCGHTDGSGDADAGGFGAEDWFSTPAETEVDGGNHEQIEQGRGEQSAQDNDRHWMLDLVPRDVAGDDQGHDGQTRGERRHQDGRQTLP